MASSLWGTDDVFECEGEERGTFGDLLGDIFQALDRLECRDEEEYMGNHGDLVGHIYLDDVFLFVWGLASACRDREAHRGGLGLVLYWTILTVSCC